MSPFESYQSYRMFERDVREKSRFIQSDQTKQFLSAINDSLESRVYVLQKNKIVWRAQVGCDLAPVYCEEDHVTDDPAPFKAERMKPLKREAAEGRANPTGIPMLYSASDRATAVAEVRPWLGAHVSVAQLRISKELRLINCFRNHGKRNSVVYLDGEPSEDVRMDSVWTDIDNAFAEPVTPNDRVAGYIPTQILAELFRNRGFDGIVFKSSVGAGYNLVIFDPDVAEISDRQVVKVTNVSYSSEWSGGVRFQNLDGDF